MDDITRRRMGEAVRRKVLGDAHVDAAITNVSGLTAEFQDLITRYTWGEIWTRPGLDLRTRRILVLGTLIAQSRWEEFRMHAAAALAEGNFSLDDLKEIILQQAVYCGVPAAHAALREIAEVTEGSAKHRDAE